jgi:hypothetical protein
VLGFPQDDMNALGFVLQYHLAHNAWTLWGFKRHAGDALVDCARFAVDNVVVVGNTPLVPFGLFITWE